MAPEKIIARTHLHSAYVNDIGNGEDAVIVSEIIETDTGEIRPNLRRFKSPKVSFWVTQKQFQGHTEKKEFESIKRLDEFQVPYKKKDIEIHRQLNGGFAPNFISFQKKRELYQSPFLYGANIAVEALVAMKYKRDLVEQERAPHSPTTGFFDIERSLLESSLNRLPMMVFTYENQVYFTMMKSFMSEPRDGGYVSISLEDVEKAAHDVLDPLVEEIFKENDDLKDSKHKLPFKYHLHVGESEVDMIRWIFGKMHEVKVSFIGVWNLGFDIPVIIDILKEANIPLEEIFADPSLRGTGYAHASFREDKREVAHITQKWHWLTNTAHFQFIDSMSLYSYIRVVEGKESSYALDDILHKFGLGGKLKVKHLKDLPPSQSGDWHRVMLSKYFTYYALYCMWDAMGLQLLEWLNNDLTAMLILGDVTPLRFFVNQTIRVTNTMYQEWLPSGDLGKVHGGQVLGTGVDIDGIADGELLTGGGAVLEPQNYLAKGLRLFLEWPGHYTNAHAWCNDVDFSAQYPTNIVVVNISKQTKLATLINIQAPWVNKRYSKADAVEVFCSYLITPKANGVEMGVEFFNLPDYAEIQSLFEARV